MADDLNGADLLALTLPSSRTHRYGLIAAPNSTVTAGSGDWALRGYVNDVLIGGAGDDTFYVGGQTDTVIAPNGGGVDTVVSSGSFVLPANVQNLSLTGSGPAGTGSLGGVGNSLDNLIIGDGGDQTFIGGGGNDIFTGGGGKDVFVIQAGQGSDLITDFARGTSEIRLVGFDVTSFAQIQSAAVQVGNDVLITLPNNQQIGLKNVQLSSLTADRFQLDLDQTNLVSTFSDNFDGFSQYNGIGGTWRTVYSNSIGAAARSNLNQGDQEIYTDSTIGINPFSVNNGILTITAQDIPASLQSQYYGYKYSSGLITSKFSHSQLYGVFEIRAELPTEKSAWPAFWLLPTDNVGKAEIDVFEALGLSPDTITTTVHTSQPAPGAKSSTSTSDYVGTTASAFHTYAVDWEPDTITWYVDGAETFQVATPADMHTPMYMLANLAIGGGGVSPSGPLDAQYQIDYINAFQYGTVLAGTGSNDTFTVNNRQQIVEEPAGGFNNTVYASIDYLLPDNVQTLILTGSANLSGFGNSQSSTIVGNSGNDFLEGQSGNDYIVGGNGANTLSGQAGNDTFVVGSGANKVLGGDGYDTLIMSGASGGYGVAITHGIGTITNVSTGAVDTVSSVENIRFANGILTYEGYGMTSAPAQIYRLYDAALGRTPTAAEMSALLAPAPANPQAWTEPFANGLDITGVATAILSSSEYQANTLGMTPAQQVAFIYKEALLQPSDAMGVAYWDNQLSTGASMASVLVQISESSAHLTRTSQITDAGLFIPDSAATADTPWTPPEVFTTSLGNALTLSSSSLLALVNDPGGEQLTLSAVGRAQHGQVNYSQGQVTFVPDSFFAGVASFTYTVSNSDKVASTGVVSIQVNGVEPTYTNDSASAVSRIIDFSGDALSHLLVMGSGNDIVYGGSGGGSFRAGSGSDTFIGGPGRNTFTFGVGVDTVTGGTSSNMFVINKGSLEDPTQHGGLYDTITDFSGAGDGYRPAEDLIRFQGFSSAAKLTYENDLPSDPTAHLYMVSDTNYQAYLVIHYAGVGSPLVQGDFGFYA